MSGCHISPVPENCAFFKRKEIFDAFSNKSRECFFYEDKGRDVSFPRWRVCFYYESHLALTKFFQSQEEKDQFLATLEKEAA